MIILGFLIFDRNRYNFKNWHPSQNTQQDDQDQNPKRHVLKMSYGRTFCQILRIELNNCKACLLAISHKLTTLHYEHTHIFCLKKWVYLHTYLLPFVLLKLFDLLWFIPFCRKCKRTQLKWCDVMWCERCNNLAFGEKWWNIFAKMFFYKSTGDTKKMDYISYYLHALFKIWKELTIFKKCKKKIYLGLYDQNYTYL